MKFNPKDPNWINRDRFVLSNGHACALLYSLLVLYKFELTVDDLKQFRQLGSKTQVTQKPLTLLVLKSPPVHWAKVSQMLLVLLLLKTICRHLQQARYHPF